MDSLLLPKPSPYAESCTGCGLQPREPQNIRIVMHVSCTETLNDRIKVFLPLTHSELFLVLTIFPTHFYFCIPVCPGLLQASMHFPIPLSLGAGSWMIVQHATVPLCGWQTHSAWHLHHVQTRVSVCQGLCALAPALGHIGWESYPGRTCCCHLTCCCFSSLPNLQCKPVFCLVLLLPLDPSYVILCILQPSP